MELDTSDNIQEKENSLKELPSVGAGADANVRQVFLVALVPLRLPVENHF